MEYFHLWEAGLRSKQNYNLGWNETRGSHSISKLGPFEARPCCDKTDFSLHVLFVGSALTIWAQREPLKFRELWPP